MSNTEFKNINYNFNRKDKYPLDRTETYETYNDLLNMLNIENNLYIGQYVVVQNNIEDPTKNGPYYIDLDPLDPTKYIPKRIGSGGSDTPDGLVNLLLKTVRTLQFEVAKLRNSFLYGINSYDNNLTHTSDVTQEDSYDIEEEPLWCIDEGDNGLSFVEKASIDNEPGTSPEKVYLDPKAHIYLNTDNVVKITDSADWEYDCLHNLPDNKILMFFTSNNKNINIMLCDDDSEDEPFNINMNNYETSLSTKYNILVCVSRKVKNEDTLLGNNYIYISISEWGSNKTLLEGYLGSGGELNTSRVDLDTRYYPSKITFKDINLYQLHTYTRLQEIKDHELPIKPDDTELKYQAAHITIRSIDKHEDLILDYIENNELIFEKSTNILWIKTDGKLKKVSGGGGVDPGDDDMTQDQLLKALSDAGIITIKNTSDGTEHLYDYDNIIINPIGDIVFVNEESGKQFKFSVDSHGEYKTEDLDNFLKFNPIVITNITGETGKNYGNHEGDFTNRGFASRYWLKTNNVDENDYNNKNAVNNSDRVKIGAIYAPGKTTKVYGCTHGYIELENTSTQDFPLDNIYLHFCYPKNDNGSYTREFESLKLSGKIPGGGTYLIRCKEYAKADDPNVFINVKTFDKEWWITNGDNKELLDLSWEDIPDGIDVGDGNRGYGLLLTYGSLDTWNTKLVNTTLKDTLKTNGNVDTYIDSFVFINNLNSSTGTNIWGDSTNTPNRKELVRNGNLLPNVDNAIFKNTFELDPAKQAFQALHPKDSSRLRGANEVDTQVITLNKEFIEYQGIDERFPISKFTPKASFEHKNVCTDKTSFDINKPNMVSCFFGINPYTTRAFNWLSGGLFDEFIWVKKQEDSNDKWTRFESYKPGQDSNKQTINNITRKVFAKILKTAAYDRITNIFPGNKIKYTSHKVILEFDATNENPIVYEYRVGRQDINGNPDEEHTSGIQTFTLYPDNWTPKIFHITDQQGFHWIEYQAWAAAARKLNDVIEAECTTDNQCFPVIVNTGDVTQNGTRINEWLDYYNGGKLLFNHLEQLNMVGNNDLCTSDPTMLGTGDDPDKSNPYFFHICNCYEVDDYDSDDDDGNTASCPILTFTENSETNYVYVPSIYYVDFTEYRLVLLNSEITTTTCESWGHKDVNVYTGFGFGNDKDYKADENGNQFTPLYTVIYNILKTAYDNNKKIICACHEMPYTVITLESVTFTSTKNASLSKHRSINTAGNLVGSHMNQLSPDDTKGMHWFSRLLENFEVKVILGGHKHTYAFTWPVRENYMYKFNGQWYSTAPYVIDAVDDHSGHDGIIKKDGSTNLEVGNKTIVYDYQFDYKEDGENTTQIVYCSHHTSWKPPVMDSTLKNEIIEWYYPVFQYQYSDGLNSLYKVPYDVSELKMNINEISTKFPIVYDIGFYETFGEGTILNGMKAFYPVLPCNDVLNNDYKGYVNIMCQATGYKLMSNKELPTNVQKFSKLIPKTIHDQDGEKITDKPNPDQRKPMFGVLTINNNNLNYYLVRINNIMANDPDSIWNNLLGQNYYGFANGISFLTNQILQYKEDTVKNTPICYGKWENVSGNNDDITGNNPTITIDNFLNKNL